VAPEWRLSWWWSQSISHPTILLVAVRAGARVSSMLALHLV
jgi:hypothetical protein